MRERGNFFICLLLKVSSLIRLNWVQVQAPQGLAVGKKTSLIPLYQISKNKGRVSVHYRQFKEKHQVFHLLMQLIYSFLSDKLYNLIKGFKLALERLDSHQKKVLVNHDCILLFNSFEAVSPKFLENHKSTPLFILEKK